MLIPALIPNSQKIVSLRPSSHSQSFLLQRLKIRCNSPYCICLKRSITSVLFQLVAWFSLPSLITPKVLLTQRFMCKTIYFSFQRSLNNFLFFRYLSMAKILCLGSVKFRCDIRKHQILSENIRYFNTVTYPVTDTPPRAISSSN